MPPGESPSASPTASPIASPSSSPTVSPSNPVYLVTDLIYSFIVRDRGRERERDCKWTARGGNRCRMQIKNARGGRLGIRVRDQCPTSCGMK
mmetsp:Transcript_30220/g.45605  ORF Transcript_30220/g.45605 Transcript_30220/m.45605 type:complete len:92 (-) Transcript_30220:545-820(-)